jgi:hypothetical protein
MTERRKLRSEELGHLTNTRERKYTQGYGRAKEGKETNKKPNGL